MRHQRGKCDRVRGRKSLDPILTPNVDFNELSKKNGPLSDYEHAELLIDVVFATSIDGNIKRTV